MSTIAGVNPDWLVDRWLEAAEGIDLPQVFGRYERAVTFAELRGWGQGEVRVFNVDGTYRVVRGDEPCGCDGSREVERAEPEEGIELDHDDAWVGEPEAVEELSGERVLARLAGRS